MKKVLISSILFVSIVCFGQIVEKGDNDLSEYYKCVDEYYDSDEFPDFKAGQLYYRILSHYSDSIVEVYDPACRCDEDTNYSQLDTLIVPEKVLYKGKIYVVKGIGAAAFIRCHRLKKVVLPNTLTYIAPDAFNECDSIISINIPRSVKRVGRPNSAWMSQYVYNVFKQLPDSVEYLQCGYDINPW